ncbi:hypothetical protein FACS189460_1470 [Deltaproteobacteria bacterium]|nr:hypothetical protein FACS189460_1470 [Deltaproteobacteria bacterium]
MTTIPASVTPPVLATLRVGRTTKTFPLSPGASASSRLIFTPNNGPAFGTGGSNVYQSTATVKVEFRADNGQIQSITDPVTWAVKSITNPSAAWWRRGPTALNSLTWGNTADGESCWGVPTFTGATCSGLVGDGHGVEGTLPNTAEIELTDVVGSRSVILEASVTIGGVTYTEEVPLSFGAGPLSVFSSASVSGQQWAAQIRNGSVSGLPNNDFTSDSINGRSSLPNTFQAAAFCGGTVNNGAIDLAGASGTWSANFYGGTGNGWDAAISLGGAQAYYANTSGLPKSEQLVAVSRYDGNYNNLIQRKGAALAAGWPNDNNIPSSYAYWTGQVNFYGSTATGIFSAFAVWT